MYQIGKIEVPYIKNLGGIPKMYLIHMIVIMKILITWWEKEKQESLSGAAARTGKFDKNKGKKDGLLK